MGYDLKRGSVCSLFSIAFLGLVIYLIMSSLIVAALIPVTGVGGLFVEAESLEAQTGLVYPQYEPDNTQFSEVIGTSTPSCEDGIPMLVVELDGEARALGFYFRKDVELPFLSNRFLSVEIGESSDVENPDRVALSGDELKLFTSQLGGESLLLRNIRVQEGTSNDKWGPESGEIILEGGQQTAERIPGIEASNVAAWLHGATGQRVTIEPQQSDLNFQISYPTTQEVSDFYRGSAATNEKFGYDLPDEGGGSVSGLGQDEQRVERGVASGDQGYFPCNAGNIPVRPP